MNQKFELTIRVFSSVGNEKHVTDPFAFEGEATSFRLRWACQRPGNQRHGIMNLRIYNPPTKGQSPRRRPQHRSSPISLPFNPGGGLSAAKSFSSISWGESTDEQEDWARALRGDGQLSLQGEGVPGLLIGDGTIPNDRSTMRWATLESVFRFRDNVGSDSLLAEVNMDSS